MTRPRFYLLAASFAAMLAFTMVATGGETVVSAAPQSAALPLNHPVISSIPSPVPAPRANAVRPQGGAPAKAAATPVPAGDYVGEATCVGCHDTSYKGTKHALTINERTPGYSANRANSNSLYSSGVLRTAGKGGKRNSRQINR